MCDYQENTHILMTYSSEKCSSNIDRDNLLGCLADNQFVKAVVIKSAHICPITYCTEVWGFLRTTYLLSNSKE